MIKSDEDVESQLHRNSINSEDFYETFRFSSLSPTLPDLKSILIKSDENKHKIFMNNFHKVCYIFGLCVLCLPLIICDIYFAINDDTCLHNKINKLQINMYDYLFVSGIWGIIILMSCSLIKYYIIRQNYDEDNMLITFILYSSLSNKIFSTAWVILGSVMFWSILDTNNCSSTIYNYLFASMIIKSTYVIINLTQKND